MKRLLLLGGTAEALAIARVLPNRNIYSLAGVGGPAPADLSCQVRVGGFGGAEGLATFLQEHSITLVIDGTHPYAATISQHAVDAARKAGLPCWALTRPLWQPAPGDRWHHVKPEWPMVLGAIREFRRPFFTLGRQPLQHIHQILPHQFWYVRCLHAQPNTAQVTILPARGPFTLASERNVFQQYDFDVLVCKNSGSNATEPKLAIARERRLPVLMLDRPQLPEADRTFCAFADVVNALEHENYL